MIDVEAVVLEQQAEDTYIEYQRQLGLIPDEQPADRTMEPVSETETEAETEQEPPPTETETQEK